MSRDMSKLDTLVFDEADQLLEMGFRPAIEQILRNLPGKVIRRFFCFHWSKAIGVALFFTSGACIVRRFLSLSSFNVWCLSHYTLFL